MLQYKGILFTLALVGLEEIVRSFIIVRPESDTPYLRHYAEEGTEREPKEDGWAKDRSLACRFFNKKKLDACLVRIQQCNRNACSEPYQKPVLVIRLPIGL